MSPQEGEFSCRIVDPSKVKVVGSKWRKHDGKRYRVLYGIPKDGDGSVEQGYRYPKDTWSKDAAQTHCKGHDGAFEADFTGDENLELVFNAGMHRLSAGPDGNLATFYLMNTSRNRLRWGVSDKALEEALPTVSRVALGCGPGHKIDKHYANAMQVGSFIGAEKPNGYALGTAQVTDDFVWEQLSSGKWGPISVVITSYHEKCSKCGEVLSGAGKGNPFQHGCVKTDDAYVEVHSFKFKRVDLIDIPAYPQAGLMDMGGAVEDDMATIPLELLAGVYESQSIEGQTPGLTVPDVTRKGNNSVKGGKKLVELTLEQMQEKVQELEGQLTTMTSEKEATDTENTELKGQLEAAAEDAKDPEKNPELKEVKERLAAIEAERKTELINTAAEARFKAKLVPDLEAEKTRLADYDEPYLKLLAEDAEKVAAVLETERPAAKYRNAGPTDMNALQEKIEERRAAIFGYTRDASGKVVA